MRLVIFMLNAVFMIVCLSIYAFSSEHSPLMLGIGNMNGFSMLAVAVTELP